jgi:SNF2 family DNA or RNA helicase
MEIIKESGLIPERNRDNENNDSPKTFIRTYEALHRDFMMDETFVRHETPDGFKKELMPHQQTSLAAMLDLEEKGEIIIRTTTNNTLIKFCCGMLTGQFGSGKTVVILALLVTKPLPNNKHVFQVSTGPYPTRRNTLRRNNSVFFIEKKFRQDLILRPVLIFVASSVLLQWKDAINCFTNLNALIISDVHGLREMYKHLRKNTINSFDIVLVKNGSITGTLQYDGFVERRNKSKTRKIYSIIANWTRDVCWSRVVLDDYDIVGMPVPTSMINGLFTWFVSATLPRTTKRSITVSEHKTLSDVLKYHDINVSSIVRSSTAQLAINIRNAPEYIERSVSIGFPVFWVHNVVNSNRMLVQMIGTLAGDKAMVIMEMLNGDAIRAAADVAGIRSNNVADIFKKILNDQYKKYALASNTITWIESQNINSILRLPPPPQGEVYHQKHIYEQKPIEYNYQDIKNKLEAVKSVCIADKEKSDIAISRVKNNIKEGICPVCYCDLGEDDSVIVRCCGKVLCALCGNKCLGFVKIDKSISGKCPNCRRLIGYTDLVHIDKEFNLDDIVSENPDCDLLENSAVAEDEKPASKFDILKGIILGEDIPNKVQKTVRVPGILVGIKQLPDAPVERKKVIIFSAFDESLNTLEKNLRDEQINYKRLGGTAAQLNDIALDFQNSNGGVNVLLINGHKYASGVNLQSATDLVFMHKIIDRNIEAQIIGRIQRLGRQYRANIHYILYEEEYPYMNFY